MATKKISELEEINQAENDDYLVVVDTSESKNKKITKGNFLKISDLEEKISDLENNQLTASIEGTSIDINDSADYQVREMIPNGNVIQNGTPTPSNQVPINSAGDNINLFDKTANITRGYTYTSTGGTTQLNNCFVQEKYIEVESSKEYILSTTNSYISETDYRLIICEYDSSKNFIKRNLSSTQYYKITTSATTKYVRLCASTVTIDELKFEHGSIVSPYTSYGMGSINEVISNKNLFNMDGKPIEDRLSSAGYTLKYNDDKTITINGTGTGAYKFLSWDLTLEAGTYIASGCPSGGSQNGYSFLINVGSSSYWDYGNGVSFTLIAKTTIQVYPIRIGSTIPTFNNVTFKPMIRLSSTTSTSFVPHQEQNISIPCQQPMRSIGNVRDSFVKIDGVWYEKHNIGQVVLNGSESGWAERGNTSENYIKFRNANALPYDIKGDLLLISDYFVTNIGANNASYSGNAICGNSGNYAKWLHISIDNTIVNSVETFKTWLSTHNTEVIYQLAEPIYLECTEEQITALEQARTYKPVTHISSADVVPAYLGVTYVRDLETVINNLS